MTELLLGLDLGTSSSKAVLARPDGSVVATAERPHELPLPRPGWAEELAELELYRTTAGISHRLAALHERSAQAVATRSG